jgi:hypothetical protein
VLARVLPSAADAAAPAASLTVTVTWISLAAPSFAWSFGR